MSPLDEIRARHQSCDLPDCTLGTHCLSCLKPWPCDAARLVALLSPEAVAEALDGVLPRMPSIQYAEPLYGLDWDPDAYYLRVATEVLAALTEKPQETK